MSPILRLSGLSRSIFDYDDYRCRKGVGGNFCEGVSGRSVFGYDANTLFLVLRSRQAEDIRFIKKPKPEEWEEVEEFAGTNAQIRILENKSKLLKKPSNALFFFFLTLLVSLGLITVCFFFYILHKQPETRRRWMPIFKIMAIYFLLVILIYITRLHANPLALNFSLLFLPLSSMVMVLFGVRGLMDQFLGKKGVVLSVLDVMGSFGAGYLMIFPLNALLPPGGGGWAALFYILFGSVVTLISGLLYIRILYVERKEKELEQLSGKE
jgi:hypothetical protein